MSVDLSKYLNFQKKNYTKIYVDLDNKFYDSGWVEYVLPRMESQCDSPRSVGTGLNSEKEVKSFWSTKLLRENYLEILKILTKWTKEEYESIISQRGRLKIEQSMAIFEPLASEKDVQVFTNFKQKFGLAND